jgi:uncharacterized damage-inducible protein DinB
MPDGIRAVITGEPGARASSDGDTMTRDVIVSLYDYGAWATDRLLARAASLPASDLTRRFSQGYDSIHQTFLHLLSADRRWLARWRVVPLPGPITAEEAPTLDAIRTRWGPLAAERRAYLAGLTEADLAEVLTLTFGTTTTRTVRLARWQGIVQCANHGTQHRAEIAAMLTDLGQSPGDLDYSLYCEQRG